MEAPPIDATLDMERLGADALRALRGARSREAFARRIGCSANAIYAWETARRAPPADVLFRAADRSGVHVPGALRRFLRADPPWLAAMSPDDEGLPMAIVTEIRGAMRVGDLADRAGLSRFTLARWGAGAVPRLPEFLGVVQAATHRVLDLLATMVDPAEMPSAAAPWRQIQAGRRLMIEQPWAEVVALALDLDEYRQGGHDEAWIARRLGLEPWEVRSCLERLVAAGVVREEGGRFVHVSSPHFEILTPESKRRARAWGARRAADQAELGTGGLLNFTLFTASSADLERLEALHREYLAALRAIATAPTGADHLLLANVHLFEVRHLGDGRIV